MKPRSRDYQRIYKACEWCRKKKTRCFIEERHRDTIGAPCIKCKRESRQCSFSAGSAGSEPRRQSITSNSDGDHTLADARKGMKCLTTQNRYMFSRFAMCIRF